MLVGLPCLVSRVLQPFPLKNMTCDEAVRGMNAAAGTDNLFHLVDLSHDLKRMVGKIRQGAKQ
jgi:hypothetical protein